MVEAVSHSGSVKTRFIVHACHPCLPGHFPEQPLVPGVVILEEVQNALLAHWPGPAPTCWPQVKFLLLLLPEQWAEVALEQTAAQVFSFQVRRGNELIASGKVQR